MFRISHTKCSHGVKISLAMKPHPDMAHHRFHHIPLVKASHEDQPNSKVGEAFYVGVEECGHFYNLPKE